MSAFDDWYRKQEPIPAQTPYLQTDMVQIYQEAERAFNAGRPNIMPASDPPKEPGRYLAYYPGMYGWETVDYDIDGFSLDGDGFKASHWTTLPDKPGDKEISND